MREEEFSMTITNLASAIEMVCGYSVSDICSRTRTESLCYARRVYITILINVFGLSDEGIGSLTRRHRTSIYGCRKNWKEWCVYDNRFYELLKSVKNQANSL
jgi:chromosomal replication initiation ATPase DnaA